MNSELQQQEDIRISVCELKFKRKSIMKQGNNPTSTSCMVKAEEGKVLTFILEKCGRP